MLFVIIVGLWLYIALLACQWYFGFSSFASQLGMLFFTLALSAGTIALTHTLGKRSAAYATHYSIALLCSIVFMIMAYGALYWSEILLNWQIDWHNAAIALAYTGATILLSALLTARLIRETT